MKISIILPTYNRAGHYLSRAIESVITQSYKDWELIIIDNNSKDGTQELVESYKNEKIHFYTINNDGNIAKSRNLGISKASGTYIAFLDSDDYWFKSKLEICMTSLYKNKNYQCICHSENWVYPDNKSITKDYGPENNYSFKKLLMRGNCISLSATMVKKSILTEVDYFSENDELITAEDYDLWIKISKNYNFLFINDVLGAFCLHNDSESANILRNSEAVLNVIRSHVSNNDFFLKRAISNALKNKGKQFYINNKRSEACMAYFASINDFKSFVRAILLILILLIPYKFISRMTG
ncbi:MAG: glycosyltransferase [Gammaproteobacteria bacterium]|nr:glycosyltransferase [Gammaproteobacteria bacterium]